ncbi:hypothetical protein BDN71DRAFT_1513441 [Pleurotus eryngii]|uniref:Uncharacterized protein n=1 Tax=Pleurotus eryngii TaxID=5323 RepID=A0A9P6D9T5_PLEER|nr:hypothetical protein BDN71DRAFT_1513441 [Pleurotus eryngii]
MTSWCPNLLGDHSSLYNAALEAIAIWTFEQAVTTFTYAHMRVNPKHTQNTQLIQSLYRNFVWSYMKNRIVKDLRSPGIVAQADLDNKAYKQHSELTMKCAIHLQNNGWNEQVKMLTDSNECTSNDECNASGNLHVLFKRAQNPHVTSFYCEMDTQRINGTPLLRGQCCRYPDPQVPHPFNKESDISRRLPEYCLLDWFDPDYFNSLDISIQALYIGCPIALPLPVNVTASPTGWDWKTMGEKEFINKYGYKVRALYNVLTKEDLAAMNSTSNADTGNDDI